MKARVLLHNDSPEAVSSTRAAIEGLPGGGRLIEDGGVFFVEGSAFILWACAHQGYVAKVLDDSQEPVCGGHPYDGCC